MGSRTILALLGIALAVEAVGACGGSEICTSTADNYTLGRVAYDEAADRFFVGGSSLRPLCYDPNGEPEKYVRQAFSWSPGEAEPQVEQEYARKRGLLDLDPSIPRLFEGQIYFGGPYSFQVSTRDEQYELLFSSHPGGNGAQGVMEMRVIRDQTVLARFLFGIGGAERIPEE